MINPISVSLGLFLAVGGWILGGILSSYLEQVADRKRARREWQQRTGKGVDFE